MGFQCRFSLRYMFYSIEQKIRSSKLNESAALQNQVENLRLQDTLGQQNFHEDKIEVVELVSGTVEDVSKVVTKTTIVISNEGSKTITDLNENFSELMNGKVIVAPYLETPLVIFFKT